MRSNGFCLALSLLLPPAVFAQTAELQQQDAAIEASADAVATPAAGEATPMTTADASTDDAIVATEPVVADPAAVESATAEPAAIADTGDDATTATEDTQADPAVEPPADATTATDAEHAFADIYGAQGYNPVADPTLPEAAQLPGAYDPWEKYNRRMHRFNNAVDRRIAKPLARGYVRVVPRPMRLGVSNFFNNLGQPLTMVNSLLQGKPKQAGQSFGRFLLNSTVGIGGLFDPASRANIPNKSEDFGQTLGVWGWKRSRYFELPFFGPRTVRDVFGMVGDAPLSPLRQVDADKVRVPLQGLQLVDVRVQLLPTDSLREGAEDDYALVRDAWSQRRDYQISGDRAVDGQDLPDYLREEEHDATVPVDAMPVTVPGNG